MRKTKIVCTIGPACRSEDMLQKMIESGMNVARLNFSHGDHEYHAGTIEMLKTLRDRLGVPLAIMLDTKGPEIRLKDFVGGEAFLTDGDLFTLTSRPVNGTAKEATVSFAGLAKGLKTGDTVLINDGKIELTVETATETDAVCRVTHGGRVSDHKGINVPGVHLEIPHLGEQDKNDLLFGVEQGVDFVSASFIRCKQDVVNIRKFLDYNGGHAIKIISKIENREGIENFDEILAMSDGIMVARGDMGVEIDYTRLPGIQKQIILKCYRAGKMVITATQMLESMVNSPTPTRAEITDVANAVFDGTSAVMLSGETAAGQFPLNAVRAMAKIAEQAEADSFQMKRPYAYSYDNADTDITNAVCDAACRAANDLNARVIIAVSKSGLTARNMSKFRPSQPIVAATPEIKTFHQLALSWGVYPVLARYQKDYDSLLVHAVDCAKQVDFVDKGDIAVLVAGVPLDTPGNTNLIKVETIS